jgi:hypothetical protein
LAGGVAITLEADLQATVTNRPNFIALDFSNPSKASANDLALTDCAEAKDNCLKFAKEAAHLQVPHPVLECLVLALVHFFVGCSFSTMLCISIIAKTSAFGALGNSNIPDGLAAPDCRYLKEEEDVDSLVFLSLCRPQPGKHSPRHAKAPKLSSF